MPGGSVASILDLSSVGGVMPYSDSIYDRLVCGVVKELRPQRVLDVGVGAGKYSGLVRGMCDAHLTGIEVHWPYLEQFNLADLYDEMWAFDVMDLVEYRRAISFDLVILGDVLEHLRRSDGMDLLDYFFYRSKHVIVVYPDLYVQEGDPWGNSFEAHISLWTPADFERFHPVIRSNGVMSFVMFDGLIEHEARTRDLSALTKGSSVTPSLPWSSSELS